MPTKRTETNFCSGGRQNNVESTLPFHFNILRVAPIPPNNSHFANTVEEVILNMNYGEISSVLGQRENRRLKQDKAEELEKKAPDVSREETAAKEGPADIGDSGEVVKKCLSRFRKPWSLSKNQKAMPEERPEILHYGKRREAIIVRN